MLKRLSVLLALVCVLALPAPQFAAPATNLSTVKQDLAQYVNSGAYGREVAAVALKANKYLAKRVARPLKEGEKRAVVFDIDETTLSNLPHIVAQDYGYIPAVWRRWVAEGQARAIVPVQLVYDLAIRNRVAVFFITARTTGDAAATERNLREVGYETWTKIYYKAEGDESSSRQYKTAIRKQLLAEGYTIVLNLGDQDSDLDGGAADRTFKLPNPFYLIK